MSVLASYATFLAGVRLALLYVGIAVAVVCAIDWAVRTRRISPFSRVARFFRSTIDPLLAPIERTIVRAGGVPSSAAWWGLVAYAVCGILLISLLQLLGSLLLQVIVVTQQPSEAWRIIVSWIFDVLIIALLVRVLSSWLPISPYSKWVRWSYVLTEWMIAPLQRIVPRIGMFDISPLVAWILLDLAEKVIVG
jgi:YggT family protein